MEIRSESVMVSLTSDEKKMYEKQKDIENRSMASFIRNAVDYYMSKTDTE